MATGMGMKSLSAFSIRRALLNQQAAKILIGIETYNATTLDREANIAARILGQTTDIDLSEFAWPRRADSSARPDMSWVVR